MQHCNNFTSNPILKFILKMNTTISKKEIMIFGKGKVPLSFAVSSSLNSTANACRNLQLQNLN